MGYSTRLYAVEFDTLNDAIGSCDQLLLKRLQEVNKQVDEPLAEVDLHGDVTLRITKEGQILFNDQPMSLDELSQAILALESGSLEVVMEAPWTKTHEAVTLANNETIPKSGLERVITRFESDDPQFAQNLDQTPQITWSRNEADNDETDDDTSYQPAFDISEEILSDLVSGNLNQSGAEHGYALEIMCYTLGKLLPDDDLIGDLEPLELDTPLQQPRIPVPLKEYNDFPVISFLTAEEVAAEFQRLSRLNLEFPSDEDIEEAREAFFECIKTAAGQKLGVMAFYH
ncbi:MAG: hypothetical protein CME32_31345 [Gimesia sp.]|nr:hypothetical protein [Gimesia sp.]